MSESTATGVSMQELQLATRNHGLPLEALRYPVTPVGMHYLLTHFDIPVVDPETWRLRVGGCVHQPAELTLGELRGMPSTTRVLTMECAGNGRALVNPHPASQPWLVEAVGTGEWTGVELSHLLANAGVQDGAVEVVMTGLDRGIDGGEAMFYQRSVTLETATSDGVLLAYQLNGAPLPPQHGFPMRVVVPRWYGMGNVKWLSEITVVDRPFTGYQQMTSYRLRQDEHEIGEPLTRIQPRSLMVPPGIPEFLSRSRVVPSGEVELFGRAWSGMAAIARVEVSTDGGATWADAELEPASDAGAWIGWRFLWSARPGDYELCCRTTDTAGNAQPAQPAWNRGGYANNAVHRVQVHVTDA